MGFLRGIGMFFVSLLIIFSLVLLGLQFSTSKLLDLNYYDSILNKSGSYEIISSNLLNSQASLIKIPSENNLSRIQGVRQLVLYLFGNTLNYLKGKTATLDLNVEVDSNSLKSFFISKIDSLLPCTNGQSNYDSNNTLVCRSPQNSSQQLLDSLLAKKNLTSILEKRSYNLAEILDKDRKLDKIKPYIHYYILSRYILIFLIALLVFLVIIFSLHKEDSAFRWIGLSIIISSGILLYLHSFLVSKILTLTLFNSISNFIQNPLLISQIIFTPLLNDLHLYATVLLVIGLVVFFVSFFLKEEIKKKE